MTSPNFETQTQSKREWYILLGPKYQGPFSQAEVDERLDAGSVGRETLAWRDGMLNWEPLDQIMCFKAHAEQLPPGLFNEWTADLEFADDNNQEPEQKTNSVESAQSLGASTQADVVASTHAAPIASEQKSTVVATTSEGDSRIPLTLVPAPLVGREVVMNDHAWRVFLQEQNLREPLLMSARRASRELEFTAPIQTPIPAPMPMPKWQVALVVICALMGTMTFATALYKMQAKPIPVLALEDLTQEQNRELQSVISDSIKSSGPSAAMAMSNADPYAPVFYIGTNLPTGASLNVQIDGLPDTLIDKTKISVRATAIAKQGLAKTPALRQEQGLPFPMGEYRVTVSCDSCEKTEANAVLAQKTFFVGGVKNRDYDLKLKQYHDRLRVQAKDELTELKQFAGTLENQLTDTTQNFTRIITILHGNKSIPWPGHTWPRFHPAWTSLQEQLNVVFTRWTPDALENSSFYTQLYGLIKLSGEQVGRVHQAQTEYLNSRHEDQEIESKIESGSVLAWTLLRALREKISTAESMPPTANGMPQRP